MSYLDFYNISARNEAVSVRPAHDGTPLALAELRSTEQLLAIREAEAARAIAAVEAQEAIVKGTKATDYVAREQAIAPLRKLVPVRDAVVQVVAELRETLAQRQLSLAAAIGQRRSEIARNREKVAGMVAELDRQEGGLAEFERQHLATIITKEIPG
jgi:hypothetical protein